MVGILTFHNAHNYGAVLQAYALKEYLNKLIPNNVIIVDYLPPEEVNIDGILSFNYFKRNSFYSNCLYLIKILFVFNKINTRRRRFNRFIYENLSPVKKTDLMEFKLLIYGSDQIWKYSVYEPLGFNSVYFGDDVYRAERKISYAASMGIIYDSIENRKFLLSMLANFDSISVRESTTAEYLKSIGINKLSICCDPVFLLKAEDWTCLSSGPRIVKEKYLLYYALHQDPVTYKFVNYIADKMNLKVIFLVGNIATFESRNIFSSAGPVEFLSLFRFADFVVSSSFHGTAFSIIFKKQFYCYLDKNSERILSLLSYAGLENRFSNSIDTLNLLDKIDFSVVQEKMEPYIEGSKMYLISKLMC